MNTYIVIEVLLPWLSWWKELPFRRSLISSKIWKLRENNEHTYIPATEKLRYLKIKICTHHPRKKNQDKFIFLACEKCTNCPRKKIKIYLLAIAFERCTSHPRRNQDTWTQYLFVSAFERCTNYAIGVSSWWRAQ